APSLASPPLPPCPPLSRRAAAQKLEVLQSQGPVSVSVGQTLTLNCMLRGDPVPGGVRWHKGSDRQQPPIYSQKQPFPRRVIRVIPESNTDFTIRITDIRPEDAGTYFCVKYRLRVTGESEQASGAGTEVSPFCKLGWGTASIPDAFSLVGKISGHCAWFLICWRGRGFEGSEATQEASVTE
uniref:Ig-like domain-containing protein n=1 Tax=Varanus komodoensis TaxID=61221 RepID=A0A8D2L5C9_VARKO